MACKCFIVIQFSGQKIKEKDTLDELFADLDQNGDLEIDFKEFIGLVAMVTSACNELFIPKQP